MAVPRAPWVWRVVLRVSMGVRAMRKPAALGGDVNMAGCCGL